jgi:peroxin-19
MERLKNSDSSAAASAGGAGGFGDADLEKLMAALGGGGAGGEGGDEDLAKMLENMMGELMSKEVLYEPLKELRDKVSVLSARHSVYAAAACRDPCALG